MAFSTSYDCSPPEVDDLDAAVAREREIQSDYIVDVHERDKLLAEERRKHAEAQAEYHAKCEPVVDSLFKFAERRHKAREEAIKQGKLADVLRSDAARQCRIWRAELSQRLLSEIASSPEGPRESELRRILAELDGAVVPRAKPTPACRQLLAGLSLEKVEYAAWSVIRHAEKTGDIPEEAKLVEQILDAVLEDMKGAAQ